jgi:two-component system CheB/CheR fusion protein
VIDRKGRLVAANVRAETLFNLRPRDVGRPFQDLEVSYRPVELRSVIDEVTTGQRPAELTDVVWHRAPGAEPSVYDVNVVPLYRYTDEPVGVGVSFLDVTKYRQLREELERSNHDLEQAYEELQSTNEELETTNEELQSTNEELETMNEELQSTNDELQMINDVLRLRGEELDTTKAFAASTLRSLGSTVVVVDTDLRVQVWGPGAEDLWGLRSDEATAGVRRPGYRPAGQGRGTDAGTDPGRRAGPDRGRGRGDEPAGTPPQHGAGAAPAARRRR